MTQYQLYAKEAAKIAAQNALVMDLIRDPDNPLTSTDLYRLIERWPARYGRFRGLADTLAAREREAAADIND